MEAQGRTATGGTGEEGTGRVLLTVVVPTRSEADNVAGLVCGLREGLAGVGFRIVFVDDSTDGPPGGIRGRAEGGGRVTLVHREGADREGGLSTAVTTGMEQFSPESEFTCVMDADGQHPPEKVREMLEVAEAGGADVVVASRHARGGSYEGAAGARGGAGGGLAGAEAGGAGVVVASRYARGGSYEGLSGWTRRAVSLGSKGLARGGFTGARQASAPPAGRVPGAARRPPPPPAPGRASSWCATRPSRAYSSAQRGSRCCSRSSSARRSCGSRRCPSGSGRAPRVSPRPA